MRRILLALCCVLPLLAAACDSSPTAPSIERTTFAPELGVDIAAMTKSPSGLYYRDLAVGNGAVVTAGRTVSVHYRLWLPSGQLIDANQPPSAPFDFVVGGGKLIPGFDEGVRGMRVGGRRQLVIPPSLGYGSQPQPGLPGNSILVFEVEVVDAR